MFDVSFQILNLFRRRISYESAVHLTLVKNAVSRVYNLTSDTETTATEIIALL